MNQIFKFCMFVSLFFNPTVQADEPSKDLQAKKLALEIIASISDDLATLIINKHHEKDPKVTQTSCIHLISTLADAIAALIIKIKAKKEIRGIDLVDDVDCEKMLIAVAHQLNEKIDGDQK
ncbi:hypothetical protein A3J41_01270 [candidate division TM6 bacterium RIFCSPHIGHO2_12_FULL_38_8]|nr:MAG: hypothetical protein A3J41_01270 [candidate division TM6 bacterium RIFCSPHIGHO2_12_FULL_38_8]